ncbi:MAG: hypothetical protein A4E56_00413 [Pelotomaculum sp. PtaU1.Bin065]|nr:MAG: hypothetical protein A4E56_00413 [Pelotomaculum sp. PtaU1.Bin065]
MMEFWKEFWRDDSGEARTIAEIGYIIGAMVFVGTMVAIGVTTVKNKSISVMGDFTSYKVEAPSTLDTTDTSPSTSATITAGTNAPTTITINN